MDDELELLSISQYQNEYGIWVDSEPELRTVFCKVNSISRSEFFQAGRNGMNPDHQFTVFAGDYEDERECVFRGRTYTIYRAYRDPGSDYIELYAQERIGGYGA